VQGAVVLQVRIGQAGGVEDVKLVSGSPLLAPSAMAAVKQWKFKPTLVNGRAVEMETTVTLNFKLPG
jgi:protein TonB